MTLIKITNKSTSTYITQDQYNLLLLHSKKDDSGDSDPEYQLYRRWHFKRHKGLRAPASYQTFLAMELSIRKNVKNNKQKTLSFRL